MRSPLVAVVGVKFLGVVHKIDRKCDGSFRKTMEHDLNQCNLDMNSFLRIQISDPMDELLTKRELQGGLTFFIKEYLVGFLNDPMELGQT